MSLHFESFELRAFGPFTATELELGSGAGGGLHIICGPNEAGKSSAQRGIGDFLFGIPPRSTDDQIHEYVDMRLAAVLVDEHGRRHELVRRKGARSTLLGPDHEPVDEALLDGMLGGMTRDVFESMFSITHESLVVGGKALLAADGNVGESLFSASLGATGLHALRSALAQQVSALFRPRAFSSAVLQARSAFDSAQTELRELTLRAGTFTEHERQVKAAAAGRKALVVDIGHARTMQNERERLRSVIPLLTTRERILEELESLAGAPELPDDARERRLVAAERETADRQTAEAAHGRVEDLQRRIDEVVLDTTLLEREQAIKELHGRLANVREGAGDLDRQTTKLEGAAGLAQRALDQVRPDLDLGSAGPLRLTGAQRATIERALERHAKLTALLDAAMRSAEDAENSVGELVDELAAFDPPTDTVALAAVVSAAHADGQIETRLIGAEAELAGAIDQLEAELRQLDPAASVDALRGLRPPSPGAVNAFADERDDLEARSRDLVDGSDRLAGAIRDLRAAGVTDKVLEVVELRRQTIPYKEIAARLSISISTAHYRQSRYEQAGDPIPFVRVWVRLLCAAGLRIDEACRVRRCDVDLIANCLRVGHAKTPAGIRTVQLTPDSAADLERYLQMTSERPASGLLLPTSNGTPYNRTSAATSVIKPLVAQTNVVLAERNQPALRDGVTAHALRKTYFTFLHEAGAPPRWVADQGGHSDPSTSLRIYTESLRGRERGHHGQAFDDLLNGESDRGVDPARPRPVR